jgi:hypothetical protein
VTRVALALAGVAALAVLCCAGLALVALLTLGDATAGPCAADVPAGPAAASTAPAGT